MSKKIWALSDLHLACAVPAKNMDVFGPLWEGYMEKMQKTWLLSIHQEDLVLIPGDISWAMHLAEATKDLEWIDVLPGTKIILKGNHDYWWDSVAKMSKVIPPSIHFIHNSVYNWHTVTIGGARLWDSAEYNFNEYVHFQENGREKTKERPSPLEAEKIFHRDLERLRLSLKQLSPLAKLRIALTHYPPISADLRPSLASKILEEFKIDICVFGHLHNLKKEKKMFGEIRGIRYILASCDYLDFNPILIGEI